MALRERVHLAEVCLDGDGAWFTDQRGLQWGFDPAIWDSTLGAATGSTHEATEIDAVCRQLDHTAVVVDVGANIGTFAIPVTRATMARVIAVEPVSTTFALLDANVRRNGVDGLITRVRAAVGDAAGDVVLTTGGQSANYVLADQTKARAGEEQVPSVTLDELLRNERRVDLIKVDVEGLELSVLRGALETLARHSPTVLLEIEARWTARYGHTPDDVFELMAERGYRYQPLTQAGLVEATDVAADLKLTNNFWFMPQPPPGVTR